jgi:hypothetical protein
MNGPLRIGNMSGFYGDRAGAMHEMLTGGDLDVLTGDYLAELTMLILGRDRMKDDSLGYAKSFLRQLRDNLAIAVQRGVKIVVNAGGVNPAGLAAAVREMAVELAIDARVAHVEGDDLLDRADEFDFGKPLTANAYLGAWGIVECLNAGADVVITGRVTDAALIVGPAAAHFGWSRTDYDKLAGAVAAGHVIECGTQATGGNYSFFTEIDDLVHPGFPIAEIAADGSSVITKHDGTGGAVTTETVTAQLLYEIAEPTYLNPDVSARFDTLSVTAAGADRVRISGTKGEPPPPTVKVCLNTLDGFRNAMTFVLCGLDVEAKADLVRRQLLHRFDEDTLDFDLARTDRPDAGSEQTASALLQVTIRTPDPRRAKEFSRVAVELALGSYAGFTMTSPPGPGSPVGVYTAAFVDQQAVHQVAMLPDGTRKAVAAPQDSATPSAPAAAAGEKKTVAGGKRAPLGSIVGARSGDKGGNANLGVWARNERTHDWLAGYLTVERLRELLPETRNLRIERFDLPNLRAINFVIHGLLGKGVAASTRFDPQAKSLGEWFRSRVVEIPEELL